MLAAENVATPATAATPPTPVSGPPPAFLPMTSVTLPVNPVAVLPFASFLNAPAPAEISALAPPLVLRTLNPRVAAVPAVILNAVLVPVAGPVALAVRVYAVPTLSMLAAENVATPATAATGPPPDSVPPPALVPMASVTLPVNPVAVLPFASRAVTSTAGAMLAPATVLVGCTVNTSVPALPAVMLKPELIPVRLPLLAVRVYPVPVLSIDSPGNVATPPDAAWVAVPDKTPPDGLVPMASVTLPVKPVAVFPFASRAVTSTAGVMLPPATVLVGCTVNTRVAALPAVTLNAVLVPVAGPVALAVSV